MNDKGTKGIFAGHEFLAGLTERQLMILESGARPFTKAAGEYLGKEGESANSFFLIQQGRVSLETRGSQGQSVSVQHVGPGEVVGWSWLVPPHRWQFDARALDGVRGLAFDAEWLRDLCDRDHELGYHLMKTMVNVLAGRLVAERKRMSKART